MLFPDLTRIWNRGEEGFYWILAKTTTTAGACGMLLVFVALAYGDTLLETLAEEDWATPTLFMEWTPWDIVAHLHYFDLVSLDALAGREAFAERQKGLIEDIAAKMSTTEIQRKALADYDAPTLLAKWKTTCDEMSAQLAESDPKRRLPWFGPDMGVQMFTTARLMETGFRERVHSLVTVSSRFKMMLATAVLAAN